MNIILIILIRIANLWIINISSTPFYIFIYG